MDKSFPIRVLKPLPIICLTLLSLAIAFGANEVLLPQHGRIVFFSSIMSLFAIYSSLELIKRRAILLFVIAYVLVHVSMCFIGALSDQSYYGAALIPLAILDYILFVYGASFLYKNGV